MIEILQKRKPCLLWFLSVSVLLLFGVVVLQAVLIAHTRKMITGQPLLQGQDHRGLAHHHPFSSTSSTPAIRSRSFSLSASAPAGIWNAPPQLEAIEQRMSELIQSVLVEVNRVTPDGPDGIQEKTLSAPPAQERIRQLQRDLDVVFQRLSDDFVHLTPPGAFESGWDLAVSCPSMAIREDQTHYVITFALPGMGRTNIAVYIEDRDLTLIAQGSNTPVAGANSEKPARSSHRRIERRLRMPGPVDRSIPPEADFKDDRLTITVYKATPGLEETKRVRIF
jgi:HSP20 family molecular chaperone IbpA